MITGVWKALSISTSVLCENVSTSLLVFLLSIIVLYVVRIHRRSTKLPYPPGPWGFPIVGHLPMLGKNPIKTITKYRQQYGDIFSIRMGSYDAVVLNGFDVIKKALTDRLDDFAGRPQLYSNKVLTGLRENTSLTFSEYGPAWKVQRRISNSALRMFASYRNNPVEEIIHSECTRLIQGFLKENGRPFDLRDETALAAGSVIYQILFGRNSNIREDITYLAMVKNINDFAEFVSAGNPVDVMPWTRFIFPNILKRFVDITSVSGKVFQQQMERHVQTYDPNDLRDVSDALLFSSQDITAEEKRLGVSSERIISVVNDFLGAGSDTVGTFLMWSFLHMATSPEVQEKVQIEIDQQIGDSRQPTYDDRKKMPYVEATILEVFRRRTIAPLAIPHLSTCDVELMGYSIPKDTFIMVNLASTCNDPKVWGDPDVFRPERFINEDGIDSSKAEMVLSFGAGRRRCIGEFLAKVEVFMFFTSVFQRCTLKTVPGHVYDFSATFGLSMKPTPFNLIVVPR